MKSAEATGNWKKWLETLRLEDCIVRLLISYCLCSAGLLLAEKIAWGVPFTDLSFMNRGSMIASAVSIVLIFCALSVLAFFVRKPFVFRCVLMASVSFYFFLLCLFGFTEWFFAFLCIFTGVAAYYSFRQAPAIRFSKTIPVLLPVLLLAGVIFLILAVESVYRYKSFSGGNYDMGLYSQLFYSMTHKGGTVITTGGLAPTDRFASSPAPILYALIPLYLLTGDLTPLLVLQAFALASGVIPLYLICKKRETPAIYTLTACFVWLLYSGVWTGVYFDFHEQSLLAPLILWNLYFAEKNNLVLSLLFCILTIGVGIEGVLAVLAAGLYWLCGKQSRLTGAAAVIAGTAVWLILALTKPEVSLISGTLTAGEWLRALFCDPGYLAKNLLSQSKMNYLIMMLLPLACIPLMGKRRSSYFLLLPALLTGLLSADSGDGSIFYQHAFTPGAFLVYLFAVNLPELKPDFRRVCAVFCLSACLMGFGGTVLARANYGDKYRNNRLVYEQAEQLLSEVPEQASVAASQELTAFLANRENLYALYPHADESGLLEGEISGYDCDYVVLSLFGDSADLNRQAMDQLMGQGMEISRMQEGVLVILQDGGNSPT